jgi:hypothetical protein
MKIKQLITDFKNNKKLFLTYQVLLYAFAVYGFMLTAAFVGVKLHIFDDPGGVDRNDRYFQIDKNAVIQKDSMYMPIAEATEFMNALNVINAFYPRDARQIYYSYLKHGDIDIALKAVEAVKIRLVDHAEFQAALKNPLLAKNHKVENIDASVFEWMNIEEWAYFKEAVIKNKSIIDSVAKVTDMDHRLIVAALVGEQMRLFNSNREMYKKVIRPLKILSVESKFSLGVTGIKDFTAMKVEKHLKDTSSEFYLGKKYEHLLDFKTQDIEKERYDRLVDYRNYYYSFLYAALIIKQEIVQWKKAGYDISNRPEILITLFNVGFEQSKPGPNPRVGGSRVEVNGVRYSFGSLGYEFYYSGELVDVFPYMKRSNRIAPVNVLVTHSQPKQGGFAPKVVDSLLLDSAVTNVKAIQTRDSVQ